MKKKKYIILSFILTVLGIIVGLFSLIILISVLFDVKAMYYPLNWILSFIESLLFFFSQVFLVISTIRYRRNEDFNMPLIPVVSCVIVAFLLFFSIGKLNSMIVERFILPNADKIESIPTEFSEDYSYFDISIWDFETILRYKLHTKGYDSGRIEYYEGDQEGFDHVIHLDNGDDILISSIDDLSIEESMLAGVKYMINTSLTAENAEEAACKSFVSVMGEMFIEPYDQEMSKHIDKLHSEYICKLSENEEGSFICKHMNFIYESVDPMGKLPDYAIEIVSTPEKD